MAGRPGRSGGHNKLSPQEHLLRGTWNTTRHGPRPAMVAVAPAPRPDPVPPALIEGLRGRGLAFATNCWARYHGWSPSSLELVREACLIMDALEGLRGEKGERPAQRTLLQILNALRLEP
jgi:hypothetical protein